MSAPEIRRLTNADFDDALALYRALTRDPVPVSTAPQDFATVLAHPGTAIFGAEVDGRIRSMVTVHLLPNMTSGGRAYGLIENVVTDPGFQRRGLGRMTLRAAMDHARGAGAYKLMLLTETARGAREFYEKIGFSDAEKHGMVLLV